MSTARVSMSRSTRSASTRAGRGVGGGVGVGVGLAVRLGVGLAVSAGAVTDGSAVGAERSAGAEGADGAGESAEQPASSTSTLATAVRHLIRRGYVGRRRSGGLASFRVARRRFGATGGVRLWWVRAHLPDPPCKQACRLTSFTRRAPSPAIGSGGFLLVGRGRAHA